MAEKESNKGGLTLTGIGMGIGAYGGYKQNKANQKTQDALRKKQAELSRWLAPAQEAAIAGVSDVPLIASPELIQAAADAYKSRFAANSAGSRTSGAARATLAGVGGNEALSREGALLGAQGRSNQALTEMWLANQGLEIDRPVELAPNPYAGLEALFKTAGQMYTPASKER